MAGICGWKAGVRTPGMMPDEVLKHGVEVLSRYDNGRCATNSDGDWGLGLVTVGRAANIIRDRGCTIALHGDPLLETSGKRVRASPAAILDRYRNDGPGFLTRLSGPFALAVVTENELLVAGDRLGICPIYYAELADGVVFASTLPALRVHPAVSSEIDPQSIFHYLYSHAIPAPHTVFRGVSRLLPAQYLRVRTRRIELDRYWRPTYTRERDRVAFDGLKRGLRARFRQAMEEAVAPAGKVGCFLSGGTDSSTVAGHLREVTGEPARAYSIGFAEPGFDEVGYARIAARHFGAQLREYYVEPDDIISLVPKIPEIYGEPFGNSSVIPAYYCARMAREEGIDTLLGGDGGDEIFGGNERYAKMLLFGWYAQVPEVLRAGVIEPLLDNFPLGDRIWPVRKARRYVEQAKIPMPARFESYNLVDWFGAETLFEREFLDTVDRSLPMQEKDAVYAAARADTELNRMLDLDLKFTLADNDLPKVGRMCELAGIKVAYPFLLDPVTDFAFALPANLKVRRQRLRYFFKRALADFLPREVITKSKHGFGLPFGLWAASNPRLHEFACDSVLGLKERGIVRPELIDDLLDRRLLEEPHFYGGLLWLFLILEQWYAGVNKGTSRVGWVSEA